MLMFQCPRPFMAFIDNEWRTGLEVLYQTIEISLSLVKSTMDLFTHFIAYGIKKAFSFTAKAIEFRLLHRPED